MKRVVIIDICGTLFDSNTTMDFLDFIFSDNKRYNKYKKIRKSLIIRAVNKTLLNCLHLDLIRKYGVYFLKGASKEEIIKMVDKFYDEFLRPRIIPQAWQVIDTYRNNDHYLLIVSATLDCIAEKVAQELNVNQFLASELSYTNNICNGKISHDLLRAKVKTLNNKGILPPYEMTISDNKTDINLMAESKCCFALCKHGKESFWEENLSKKQIKNYRIIKY